jgi:hypothetical protein
VARETKHRFVLRVGLILLLTAAGCSTAGVNWYGTRRIPGYVVPPRIPLVVDVSEPANAADQGGYIDTMVLTVREELGERGVESTIISPKPSRVPSPRVEIIVGTFDDGDFAESYFSGLATNLTFGVPAPLAGQMALAVVCRAYSPSNQLMFEGVIRGSDVGTANPRNLAETAGDAIADALTDPESTRPSDRRPRSDVHASVVGPEIVGEGARLVRFSKPDEQHLDRFQHAGHGVRHQAHLLERRHPENDLVRGLPENHVCVGRIAIQTDDHSANGSLDDRPVGQSKPPPTSFGDAEPLEHRSRNDRQHGPGIDQK